MERWHGEINQYFWEATPTDLLVEVGRGYDALSQEMEGSVADSLIYQHLIILGLTLV